MTKNEQLFILNYHILYDEQSSVTIKKGESVYAIDLRKFKSYIKYLLDNQYQVASLEEYSRLIKDSKSLLPPFSKGELSHPFDLDSSNTNSSFDNSKKLRPVIITFDDGHVSHHDIVMPALQEYQSPATFFVTVEKIGSPNFLTWKQLRQMSDNGMSIMSHTMTHAFLSDIPSYQVRWELQESKKILEQELGRPVSFLSLPGGRCSKNVKEIAKEVGYKGICTSIVGYNHSNTDPYSLRRWTITRNMRFSTFQAIAEGKKSTLVYYKSRQFLLNGMKRMIGNKLYASIHREISSVIKPNTEK